MNLRRITLAALTAMLVLSQGTKLDLSVQAEEVYLGSEEMPDTQEHAFYVQGKKEFADLISDHTVYALLYKTASINVMKEPSYDAVPVIELHVGHQVELTDVAYVQGQTWYQIKTTVGGKEYTGYLADALLVSADEGLIEWRKQWLSIAENSIFTEETAGSAKTDLSLFPKSYHSYIQALTDAHPNWIFVPLDTGLDWNTVIKNEMSPARNLVPLQTMDTWKESNDVLSAPYWVQASESIVRYYMDPRNFLNEEGIFQFELLSYNSHNHKLSGVKSILKNTFMSGTILEGTEMTYAEAFMKIGKELKISPYHLASRVRQEQGTEGTSPLISGTYPGYEGLYNYYNIQASGVTYEDILINGFLEAQESGWTDRYSALFGGSEKIGENYIKVGQNTLYLQKFDVDDTDGILYWHQYMQNLLAAANEGKSVKKGYEEMGVLNSSFVFSIPVYENMPETAVKIPTDTLRTPNLKTSIKKFTDVTLNWSEIPGAQGYEIYRSTNEKSGYKKVKTLTSVGILNWMQTIETNKVYYYKVRGYKTFLGVTARSPFSPVKMVSSIIPVPQESAVKQNSYTKVTINWEKAKNVTGYEVYRKTGKDGKYQKLVTVANTTDANTLSFTDTTVSPKNTYFYKVRSYKLLEGKKHYSKFDKEHQITIKMETPVLNAALLSKQGDLTIDWKKEKWVTGYQIYRAEGANGKYQLLKEIKGQKTITYTDNTIKDNKIYYYKIRSYVIVNKSKKYSGFSNEVLGEIRMTKPVFKPEYTASKSKITLKWNKNPIASGYELQQKVGKRWNTVVIIRKNNTDYVIDNLQPATTYQFRIRAYKGIKGQTSYSPYVSFKATTAPDKAVISEVKNNTKKELKINWKPMKNVTGYQVQISLNKDFKKDKKYKTVIYELNKQTSKTKTIKSLTSGKKYHIRLRAYRTLNKQTVYGGWSVRKEIKVK